MDLSASYDSQLKHLLHRRLRADSTCLDIGAHRGDILEAMFQVAPQGRHFAFEPIPGLAAALRDRFPTARVHGCALSDEVGEASFFFSRNSPAESGLRRTHTHSANPDYETIRVPVATVDSIVPPNETVAVIKIDAEGAEIPILRGARATVLRCKPWIFFEAGSNTTSLFGVSADDIYDCITGDFGMQLTTMQRWIKGLPSFTREQFHGASHVDGEPFFGTPHFDFYFMAY